MFAKAIKHLHAYRTRRVAALHNKEPSRWFTSDAETLQALNDDIFNPEEEDDAWVVADAAGASTDKISALRMRINFVLGCRHAIRGQFAVGEESDPKNDIDFDKHALQEITAADLFTSRIERVTDSMLKVGGEGS